MEKQLVVMLLIEFFILIMPLAFIFADLWSGIRKAKMRGEKITSRKTRDTVNKIARYYNVLLVLAVIDSLQLVCIWYMNTYSSWAVAMFPWMTLLGTVFVGFIEVKSIMEPADEKEGKQIKELAQLAEAIASHRTEPEEIARAVIDYLKSNESK